MYPVDMLKVYRTLVPSLSPFIEAPQTRLQVLKPPQGGLYTGMRQAFWKIGKVEGFGSMWRGVSSVIIGAGTWTWGSSWRTSHDVMKVRRMQSILLPTRRSSMLRGETTLGIIQLLEASLQSPVKFTATDTIAAASGASATLVSDAFMNPFDGGEGSLHFDDHC